MRNDIVQGKGFNLADDGNRGGGGEGGVEGRGIKIAWVILRFTPLHFIPRLHYVPGGHGCHVLAHGGQNGVTVRQRRGTVSTNVSRRDCRGRRGKFLNI